MPHMMQLMDTVRFLGNARIVHRAINPSSVLVTSGGAWELARGGRILVPVLSAEPGMPNQVPLAGAWKLAGFGHALYLDEFVEGQSEGFFAYPEGDTSEQSLTVTPPREYTAPELTRPGMGKPTVGADMYSFGVLKKRMLNLPADLWE